MERFVRQAMFDGHLAASLAGLSELFASCPYPLPDDFASSCLSDDFFDSLLGLFLTNCQSVEIPSRQGGGLENAALTGVALYKVYCTMNHSCSPNIRNEPLTRSDDEGEGGGEGEGEGGQGMRGCEVVGVNVFSAEDIAKGNEIFNTYLTTSPLEMTKKQRKKKMLQYLFECGDGCTLCGNDDVVEAESDSDY